MTLNFRMTQQEYLLGCRYKTKKQSIRKSAGITSFAFAASIFILSLILKADTLYLLLPLILIGFGIFEIISMNALRLREFNTKPFLYGEQQLIVEKDGIRVQNAFEKCYADFHKIYAVKNTKKNLILLLSYRKGIYVINRERQDEGKVEALLSTLRAKGVKIDGK